MSKHFLSIKNILLLAIALFLFNGCSPSTTGSESETEMEIALCGKVTNDKKIPLKDIVVSLNHLGVSDTTDSLGNYKIYESLDTSLIDSYVIDTLTFTSDTSVLDQRIISDFTDTIDVIIYQRDFIGYLVGEMPEGSSVYLVLTTMENGDTVTSMFPLGYIESTKKYTGYGFFNHNSQANYSAYVKVVDKDGAISGRSISIPFTSIYAQIEFPPFNLNNMTPNITGVKSPVISGDTIVLALKPGGTEDDYLSDSLFYHSIKEIQYQIGSDSTIITDDFSANVFIKDSFKDSLTIKVSTIFNFGDTAYGEISFDIIDSLFWDYDIDVEEFYGDYWGYYSYLDIVTTVEVTDKNVYSGDYSLEMKTESDHDVGFVFPGEFGSIPIRNLKETDSLTFWVYTVYTGAGFQHQSPVIVFRSDNYGYDFMEFHNIEGITPFNESLNKWTYISIPLGGDSRWRRDVEGAASLDNVNQIRIHADGESGGYKIYLDKVIIKEAE